ncbi:zinc ion binding [Puccinia graminis f. sp. tritici]|uniref:Zinc ion binding n=1 Tax=Puccinia graminis f. sp. tritici TaxID=56615 RepID=A0A5B0S7V8_PUCGR|nr:zinc ion binding [Puccinia graminis f. sp. tritici]
MDEEMLQRTEEALSHLTPQDRQLFERHLRSLEAAHDQLASHPDRDRLDDDENRRYFSDRDEIEAALARLPEAVTQRLRHVLGLWEVLIFFLEESRACSFGIRRRLAQQLSQFTLSNTAAATLPTSPDGEALECTICNEELSLPDQSIVQLPCHASHLFHRDCILLWIGRDRTCPICRAAIPLQSDPAT